MWLSEIVLQQTRVDQGTPYYLRLIAAFPDVHALARAPEDRLLKLWEGLGYYTRARNLHKAAKVIVTERGGVLPLTAREWVTLPGVGRYTANAIASIAYDERVPVVDGNVIRVLTRVYNVDTPIDKKNTQNVIWSLAESLVPRSRPGDYNQAVMELGATVCTPKAPGCTQCPLKRQCKAHALGVEMLLPKRGVTRAIPRKEQVCAVVEKNGKLLLAKRPGKGLLGGLWEFPTGPIGRKESHSVALQRLVRDQFGLDIRAGKRLASVSHAYSHLRVSVTAYRCSVVAGRLRAAAHSVAKWVTRAELRRYALPKVILKFVDLV